MKICLLKCANGCRNQEEKNFSKKNTWFGNLICDWCVGMWGSDQTINDR